MGRQVSANATCLGNGYPKKTANLKISRQRSIQCVVRLILRVLLLAPTKKITFKSFRKKEPFNDDATKRRNILWE